MAVPIADAPAWSRVLEFIRTNYGIAQGPGGPALPGPFITVQPPDQVPDISLSSAFTAPAAQIPGISSGFKYEVTPEDALHFRYYHVEPLLQEAIALLDRSLSDRASYQRIGAEFLRYKLQIEEFIWLDAIHGLERPDVYRVPHEEALAALNAENKAKDADNDLTTWFKNVFERFQNTGSHQVTLAGAEAWNASLPYYQQVPGQPSATKRAYDTATGQITLTGQGLQGQDTLAAQLRGELFQFAMDNATQTAEIELVKQSTEALARIERLKGLQFKADYLKRDIDYRTMRTQVAEAIVRRRILELSRPDGALNYFEQMQKTRERVAIDLREVYARASALNKGLELLFGIDLKLPDSESPSFLDDAVNWARLAQNKLARFLRIDQNYVYSVSLASVAAEPGFSGSIGNGWRFSLTTNNFPNQCNVRMRGLSAYAQDDADGLYRVNIQPPLKAQVVLRGKGPIEVDQIDAPMCRLGRVGSRTSPRSADISGAEALHNCSPIGDWVVTLDPELQSQASQNKLKDIVVNILLAVQQL